MKFYLEIECDGAAFESDAGDDEERAAEVARILEVTAKKIRDGAESVTLLDSNGNGCGLASYMA